MELSGTEWPIVPLRNYSLTHSQVELRDRLAQQCGAVLWERSYIVVNARNGCLGTLIATHYQGIAVHSTVPLWLLLIWCNLQCILRM